MADGHRRQFGPGKLRPIRGGFTQQAAVLAAVVSIVSVGVAALSSGIQLEAVAGGNASAAADLTTTPFQAYAGKPKQAGPGKLRPTYGGVFPPAALLTAFAAGRSDVTASLITGATFIIGAKPLMGPGLAAPFNPGQFQTPNVPQAAPPAILSAQACGIASSSAALSSGIPLAATAAALARVTSTLTTGFSLAAISATRADVTAALTSGVALSAVAVDVTSASGSLSTGIVLAANAFGVASAFGTLNDGAVLFALAQAKAFASADLTVSANNLAAIATCSIGAQAALLTGITQVATAYGQASVLADLSIGSGFAAIVSVQSSAQATLFSGTPLGANAYVKVSVTADPFIGTVTGSRIVRVRPAHRIASLNQPTRRPSMSHDPGAPYQEVEAKRSFDNVTVSVDWHDYLINLRLPGTAVTIGYTMRPRRADATGLQYRCTRAGVTSKGPWTRVNWPRVEGVTVRDGSVDWIAEAITVASLRSTIQTQAFPTVSGLTLSSQSDNDLVYTTKAAGGLSGASYPIKHQIQLANGEIKEGIAILPVQDD